MTAGPAKPAEALARLVERARQELPHPGDPRLLLDDLSEQGLHGPEALEVVARTSLAWTQLRDMGLERIWQNGFGWFMARNLMLFSLVALLLFLGLRPPLEVFQAALTGAGLYYLIVLAMSPLRLRRHRHRRQGILEAYAEDLTAYIDGLQRRG